MTETVKAAASESEQKHTPGPYHWRKYGQSEEDVARLRSVDLEPTRMLTNEGQIALMAGEGDNRKRIAIIDCQTPFKRGQGYRQDCAERDANANLFAAADDMLAALKEFVRDVRRGNGGNDVLSQAEEAIARAEGR